MSGRTWGRMAGSVCALLVVVGVGIVTLPSTVSAASGGLRVRPAKHLVNGQVVTVSAPRYADLTPGDYIELIECLRAADELTSCDPATAVTPTAVTTTGRLPAMHFAVATGDIGTGTCGTSASDAKDCEIAAVDITETGTFAAFGNITFKKNPSSDVPTTIPSTTLPVTTVPDVTIPTDP